MTSNQRILLGIVCFAAALFRLISGITTGDQGDLGFAAVFFLLGIALFVLARRVRR